MRDCRLARSQTLSSHNSGGLHTEDSAKLSDREVEGIGSKCIHERVQPERESIASKEFFRRSRQLFQLGTVCRDFDYSSNCSLVESSEKVRAICAFEEVQQTRFID